MIDKIKAHFIKLGPKRFVIGAVLLLIILDLVNSYFLRVYWVHKDLSIFYVKTLAQREGIDFSALTSQSIAEVKGVIDNGFFFFLLIVLINNLFFYVFYLRKKLWAQGYILFYTVTNALLGILFMVEGPILGYSWFFYNFLTIFMYLYLYLGVKVLKYETTDALNPIPAHEKTEQ